MALRHIAPGKLLDACRFWYPEPQRTQKLTLAALEYERLALGGAAARKPGRRTIPSADEDAYNALWLFGPPNINGGSRCAELNGITLCVFGELTEDESRRSPEVDRFDPKWRTEAVVGLATKAYDERAFGVLPILADALEEAGCDNLPMLAHCREAAIHARGCWVLDHVLRKG
jgi:hypothetical protein